MEPTQSTESIPTKKQLLRQAMLRELIKKKQEQQIDETLAVLMEKYPDFKKGISHNKFGCVCLGADQLDKAEDHLKSAQQIVSKSVQFSNVYMNLGNVYAQRRNYKKAAEYY